METLLQTWRLDLLLMLLPHLTIHSSCIPQTLLLANILVMALLSLNFILPLDQANTFLSQGDNHTLEILSRSLLLCGMPGLQEVQDAFLSES